MFLALVILYPNDRLSGFAMATKTCRAAKLYQRPLNSMRSLSVLEETSESGDKRLVPKKVNIDTTTDHITPCCACARRVKIEGVVRAANNGIEDCITLRTASSPGFADQPTSPTHPLTSMLWLSKGMHGLAGVGALLRYQAVPTATAPSAIRVDGSDRKPTKDEDSDILTTILYKYKLKRRLGLHTQKWHACAVLGGNPLPSAGRDSPSLSPHVMLCC